jgi:hypothetical protein
MPLKDRFPEIYDICIEQSVTVAEAADMHWNFSFRRWMTPDLACQIHGLHQIMAQTVLMSGNGQNEGNSQLNLSIIIFVVQG